jgi:hypothetical protein
MRSSWRTWNCTFSMHLIAHKSKNCKLHYNLNTTAVYCTTCARGSKKNWYHGKPGVMASYLYSVHLLIMTLLESAKRVATLVKGQSKRELLDGHQSVLVTYL